MATEVENSSAAVTIRETRRNLIDSSAADSGATQDEEAAAGIDETDTLEKQIYENANENGRHVYRCLATVNCPTATPAPTDPTVAALATVTIRDVATFIPHDTTLTMEPAHWMLRDSPTNFIARAGEHTITTPLLGQRADVRFTPIGYSFEYGDGGTRITDNGGNTWTDLGLDEFSETDTSHTYTQRGDHTITASAVYAADYRINGGPWTPITGTVSIPTTLTARTITIDPVLVRGTCQEYPTDPGCPGWDPGD